MVHDRLGAETAPYQRLRNFARLCPPQKEKVLVFLKANPNSVDLVPGLARDVTALGHHGTGDLELQLRSRRDLDRAAEYFRHSYAAARRPRSSYKHTAVQQSLRRRSQGCGPVCRNGGGAQGRVTEEAGMVTHPAAGLGGAIRQRVAGRKLTFWSVNWFLASVMFLFRCGEYVFTSIVFAVGLNRRMRK